MGLREQSTKWRGQLAGWCRRLDCCAGDPAGKLLMTMHQSDSSYALVDQVRAPPNGLPETSKPRPGLLPSLAGTSEAGQPNNVGHIGAVEESKGSRNKPLPRLPSVASVWHSNS